MHTPAFAKALVLVLEAVQPLGKEYDDHQKEEEHQGGHTHHHAQHLELCDYPVTAHAFVPDVVLHIAPEQRHTKEERGKSLYILSF